MLKATNITYQLIASVKFIIVMVKHFSSVNFHKQENVDILYPLDCIYIFVQDM